MFVMSILFIILMMAAPALNPNGGYQTIDWSFKNLIPSFGIRIFYFIIDISICRRWMWEKFHHI